MSDAPPTSEGKAQAAQALGMHPIAAEAASLAEESRDDEGGVSFSAQALERLTVQVKALADDPDLEHALRSLVALAAYIDEDLGQEQQAIALLEVAAVGARALQRQKADRNSGGALEAAEQLGGALKTFTGEAKVRRAPAHDDAPAQGSVSLKDLLPKGPVTGR